MGHLAKNCFHRKNKHENATEHRGKNVNNFRRNNSNNNNKTANYSPMKE